MAIDLLEGNSLRVKTLNLRIEKDVRLQTK